MDRYKVYQTLKCNVENGVRQKATHASIIIYNLAETDPRELPREGIVAEWCDVPYTPQDEFSLYANIVKCAVRLSKRLNDSYIRRKQAAISIVSDLDEMRHIDDVRLAIERVRMKTLGEDEEIMAWIDRTMTEFTPNGARIVMDDDTPPPTAATDAVMTGDYTANRRWNPQQSVTDVYAESLGEAADMVAVSIEALCRLVERFPPLKPVIDRLTQAHCTVATVVNGMTPATYHPDTPQRDS